MKQCKYCDAILLNLKDKRKKFCNRSCAASFNGRGVQRSKYPRRQCVECNGYIESRVKMIYCTIKCRMIAEERDWLGGISNPYTKHGLPAKFRRIILKHRNEKCEGCGWSGTNPISKKSTLQVDHKDGDWKNNYIWNLKVLCPNCHSLTPTYGALNKGNGRNFRYEVKVVV